MSKKEYLLRYLSIIKKLRKSKEADFNQIDDYLKEVSFDTGYDLTISKRTFQRDINEIRELFSIDIRYSFSKGVYFIDDEMQSDMGSRILESFDMINSLNVKSDLTKFISFEKRRPAGTEHFYGLIHAIKNCLIIQLVHQKFWADVSSIRNVEPYAFKECQNRWYLVAKDLNDGNIKTFGLDRIRDFSFSKQSFERPVDFNPEDLFKYAFGIINGEGAPEDIILSFEPEEGKYIKTYPLHHTQEIITDDDNKLQLKLKMHITFDFIMELLSYGEMVKVISPLSLQIEIINHYKSALGQYSNR
jgi:predicted DNA-binding transcriptional regulator YafY